nr:hypothetical protein [Tanacetum cinerariifolium]
MVDVNVNAPADQAPTMAPPTHTDDQILPHIRWFGDIVRYDKTAKCYKCQLDEQWFDLTKYTLRDALQITPVNNNNAFSSPSSFDALINFVNDLGYPKVVRNLSNVVTNDMFQSWRALTTIINLCLTGKTSGFERPRASLDGHPIPPDEGDTVIFPKCDESDLVVENLKQTVKEHVILKEPASSTGTLSSLQHLAKDLSFGDLFFNDKPSKADNEKTTIKTEAESMVSITIQQDTSSIPPMTTSIIDLTSRPDSLNVHRLLQAMATETTTTITTTTHPPPPQLQQSITDSMLMKRIDIPQQVSKAVDEIVTDAVDWAIQASLRNRFRDLPEADMIEIIHQRMWETNSYKAHEDHMMLYEALEKSMNRDQTDELLKDMVKARKKKKKRHDSPKTPPGQGIIKRKPQDLEGPVFELVKVFHPNVIHLQYQMEECHKLLTDSVDDSIIRHNVSKPLPLGGPPGQVTIQSDFFFNKDLEYLRYDSKGSRHTLSISKMKAAYDPDVGLEIEVFSMYGYDYMKKIVLRRTNLNEHIIAERDFKYLYLSDFEDLYLLNHQGHLNHLPPKDKKILTNAVNL